MEFQNEMIAAIESLLFVAGDEGLSLKELRTILGEDEDNVRSYLDAYKELLEMDSRRGLLLAFLAGRYKLVTKPEYKEQIMQMVDTKENTLSKAALETLAIVAYKQPITRADIEEIRGVSSDAMVRRLLAKALIKEVGRQDTPGKPILYGVTDTFMDVFNLASLDELPPLEELTDNEKDEVSIFDIKYQEEVDI